nr:MAG TPA: hypothetical protein [Caudoviricetes sp.]
MVLRGQASNALCLTAQLLTLRYLRELMDSRAKQVSHVLTEYGVKRKTHSSLPF